MLDKAVWYRVGLFLVNADKLRKPVREFLRPALGGIEANANYTYVWHITHVISFLDQDGNEIGSVESWTSLDKYFATVLYVGNVGGYLPLDAAAFENAIKKQPALFDFDNNCEALTSGKKALVHASLYRITQERFRDHAKKAVERVEPLLRSKDRDTRELAAEKLLELVPDHKEARRVLTERKR
jgi:hypothetical protein